MDIHENARTTPRSRMLMIERLEAGWTMAATASALGVDGRTVRKWRDRYRVEGAAGLVDRSSRPHSCPSRLDDEAEAEIAALRGQRLSGPTIAGAWYRSPEYASALEVRGAALDRNLILVEGVAAATGPL